MHVVFVGGTRFIGRAAAAAALAEGHRVTVVHRGATPCDLAFVREVIADRRDPSALATALAKSKPDVVVDTRAMDRSDAEALALALKIVRVPAVVLSSQDVYAQFGKLNGLPSAAPDEPLLREDAPLTVPRPFAAIGAPHEGGPDYDKKHVEAVFATLPAETGAPAIALRLPGVYGTRDPKRRFGGLVDAIDSGMRELPCAGGAQLRLTHVHVDDAAHAIVLAATRATRDASFHVYNVGERATPTMAERAQAIAGAMGCIVTLVERSEPLAPAFALLGRFPCDCVLDTSAIRTELGFAEVTTEEECVRSVVAWARESRDARA